MSDADESIALFETRDGGTLAVVVGKTLARGGQGIVLEGRALAANGQVTPIVLKAAQRGSEKLLEAERRVAASLDHPNVVRLLGTGHTDDHGKLLAFERLGQNPLLLFNSYRPRWRDPKTHYYPLPPGRAVELAVDLLRALEHLHARGLVHGDVKLANLLVRTSSPDDPKNVLAKLAEGDFQGVLVDLGSVRRTEGDEDAPEITPLYAPPEALLEQAANGGRKRFTPAMDCYAFGLILYVILTGRTPYADLCSAREAQHPEVLLELKNREGRRDLSPVNMGVLEEIPLHDVAFDRPVIQAWPAFRAAVAHVIERCLEPDPGRRMTATQALGVLESELRFRAAPGLSRAQIAGLFQMRPRSNRLVGDPPLGGIRVTESGLRATGDETPPPLPALPQKDAGAIVACGGDDLEDGFALDASSAAKSPMAGAALPGAPDPTQPRVATGVPRPAEPPAEALATGRSIISTRREPIPLAKLLVEMKQKGRIRPLPYPVIVTRTCFDPRELARSKVLPIGGHAEGAISVTVGRLLANDLAIPDPAVSKKHLVIERDEDGWWVRDVGSSNGTWVDGREVTRDARARLRRGMSTIEVGPETRIAFLGELAFVDFLKHALTVIEQELVQVGTTISSRLSRLAAEEPSARSSSDRLLPAVPTRRMPRARPADGVELPPEEAAESAA